MNVVQGNPPVTTFADINPGIAYTNGIGDPLMKTQTAGTAVRLDTGEVVGGIPAGDVITPAPGATVTLYP